jgi:hypothetical protein
LPTAEQRPELQVQIGDHRAFARMIDAFISPPAI